MGRAPLGQAAKTVVASLRITPKENAVLTTYYGSANKALRRFVDDVMATQPRKVTKETPDGSPDR